MALKCESHLLQNFAEFQEFLRIIKNNGVSSYLEIGCKNGGSLWRIANTLPRSSRVVAVDLPQGDTSFKNTRPHLEACIAELKHRKYDARLIIGDSTDPAVVARVQALAPFDLCFIDANHTAAYVRKDWANYGPMAEMVAFHDIGFVRPADFDSKKMPIEVPQVWAEIKNGYQRVEIRLCPADNGIGILWRSRLA
jgi:hypothetical protein